MKVRRNPTKKAPLKNLKEKRAEKAMKRRDKSKVTEV
jgi:hypothetical protein